MPPRRSRALGVVALVSAMLTTAALPAAAWALAGGATGSGGGGGGGGGYSGGSGGGSGGNIDLPGPVWLEWALVAGFCLLLFAIGGLAGWWGARKRRARVRTATAAAERADLDDGYWHPHLLHERVREVFFPVQGSWGDRDVVASRPFVSDALYERHRLQLEGLEAQNRVNRIADLNLSSVELVRIHNVTDDGEDRFVARIECSARDWMEDTRTGEVVNGNRDSATQFVQFWSFARHPENGWVLDEIQQGSEGEYHMAAPLVNSDEGAPPIAPGV